MLLVHSGEVLSSSKCRKIELGGINVICLDQGVGPFKLEERIKATEKRLIRLSSDKTFNPANLHIEDHASATDIISDDLVVISIRDEDLQANTSKSRKELAKIVLNRIRKGIKADRAQKSSTEIILGVVYTILATIGLFLFFKLLRQLIPKIENRIRGQEGQLVKYIAIKNFEILNVKRVIYFLVGIVRFGQTILIILAIYVYVPLILSFFPWTANLAPKLIHYITTPLEKILRVIVDFIPNLFFIVIIIFLTRYLLKLTFYFFKNIEEEKIELKGFYKEWAIPTYKLVRIAIIAFSLIMIFPYLPGSSSPAFQAISVFFGVLLSFGSSSAVTNMIGGVVITYMRPYKIGDIVKISETIGKVIEKNLLVTRIRTIKNVNITIPNAMVLAGHIINFSTSSRAEGLILNTRVTISYDVPWRQVHELLIRAARKTDAISFDREPFILQMALNDFHVTYELNVVTHDPDKMSITYSNLHQNIQDSFNEAGVEIMSPHYTSFRDGSHTTIPEVRPQDEMSGLS